MRRGRALVVGTAVLVALGASEAAGAQGREAAALRQALAALEAGRPEEALALLEVEVLEEGPRRFAAWSLLGRTQLRLRRPDDAVRSFAEALARAPNFLPARVGKAEAEIARGHPSDAVAELEPLAALPAPPARALELLAAVRLAEEDLEPARILWRRLADLDEAQEAAAQRTARLLLLASDRSSSARDRLYLEVERDLSSASAYLALGVERWVAGDRESAARLLRIAFAIDEHEPIVGLLIERTTGQPAVWPSGPRPLRRVAEIYAAWEERRLAEAAESAREVLALRPAHAPLELLLSRIAEEQDDAWRALEGYERLLREVGALPSLAAGAARAALEVGAFGAAECAARAALRLLSDDTALMRLLAAARARAGAVDEAMALLRRATELEPDEPAGWVQLGDLLFEAMRTEEALAVYRQAVELAPGAAEEIRAFALAALASTLEAGRATELLMRHAQSHPESVDTLYSIGVARLRAGELAEAERIFERLAAAAPGHSQVAYNLAQVYRRQGRLDEARIQQQLFGELKAAEDAAWERHNQAHFRRLAAAEAEAAGRRSEALALYEVSAADGTAGVDDYLAMARLLMADGRASTARLWVEKVLEVEPDSRAALEALVAIDEALGRSDDLDRLRWKLEVLGRPCAAPG